MSARRLWWLTTPTLRMCVGSVAQAVAKGEPGDLVAPDVGGAPGEPSHRIEAGPGGKRAVRIPPPGAVECDYCSRIGSHVPVCPLASDDRSYMR